MGKMSLLVKKKMREIFLFLIILLVSAHAQAIGEACDTPEVCPFQECVKDPSNGDICICRLANKYPNGSWFANSTACTDNYSPWSLYPFQNGSKVAEPVYGYEELLDSAFKASGSYPGFEPNYARLNSEGNGKGAWCAPTDDSVHWIRVDLGNKNHVTMVATQGREGAFIPFTVSKFEVETSDDDVTYTGLGLNFTGNEENDAIVYNFLDVHTRYLKIIPTEQKNMKCLRFEVYGKKVVNECSDLALNLCDKSYADCTDTISSYTCKCKPGYIDLDYYAYGETFYTGFRCLQADECRTLYPEFKHNCSVHAKCTDKVGSFSCACNTGYVGDGYYCEDINECDTNYGECHVDAFCNNTGGSHTCNCKPGYDGDGKTCADVDECKKGLDNCDPKNGKCTNKIGSFKCSCQPGYEGDGTVCTNKNECLEYPCHEDANCIDSPGTYKCKCKDGYTGNGRWCDDINECGQKVNPCTVDELCYNHRGGYTCMCPKFMPRQLPYKQIEANILDQILTHFRDVSKEDWHYPLDHHAHTIRTIYQLVMRTYQYHFIETREPFLITKVSGDAFAVELYDLRCQDVANVTFPNLCQKGYSTTKFFQYTDLVEIWLTRKTEVVFETWATDKPPMAPNQGDTTTTQKPIITERIHTTMIINGTNGTNITLTEMPATAPPPYTDCGGNLSIADEGKTFTSPHYPENYNRSTTCVWTIEAPESHNVYVKFDATFRLETDKKCSYDFLEIRDDDENGEVLGRYCGTMFPKAVRSGRRRLHITFQTDRYYQYMGFSATWGILSPRVSIACITYNQLSTMPDDYRETWRENIEKEEKSKFVPVSRLMACRQYPQCKVSRPGPIVYTFEHFRDDRNDKICIRWDLDVTGTSYSESGCKKRKTNKTHTECECYTWGIVGVLGRLTVYKPNPPPPVFELGKNSFFSVLLVTLALVVTLLYLFLRDQWGSVIIQVFTRKEFDSGRIIQLHIVLSTLLAEIFFSIITFNVTASAGTCFFLAFIFYYLLQTVFFWLFIYTLFLQSRIQEIFDSERYNSYKIYLLVGYVVPFLVTLTITGLSFRSDSDEKLCWLLFQGTTVWGFSGVIIVLGIGTLIILFNVIYHARLMTEGILLQEKCLRTMFTTFFVLLTSIFGAQALQTKKYSTEYMFSLFNMLQGFSIAVMYCILRREDPIIRANQVGPIPDLPEEQQHLDDEDDGPKRFDLSEAETSSDEEEESYEMKELPEDKENMSNGSIFLDMKESEMVWEEEAGVDEPLNFNESDNYDSDADQEIMFRVEEADNYAMR